MAHSYDITDVYSSSCWSHLNTGQFSTECLAISHLYKQSHSGESLPSLLRPPQCTLIEILTQSGGFNCENPATISEALLG